MTELTQTAAYTRSGRTGIRVLVIGARGIPDVEGGAEKNAEALFPLVAELGFDVTVMGLKDNIKSAAFKGVKLRAAPQSLLLKTDKLAYYFAALWTAMRTNPDIVHLQGLGAALFLFFYKLLGKKVVVRYGSADYVLSKWGHMGRLGFLFCEWQLRFADAVISVTPALSHRLAAKGIAANVHTVANAVDTPCPPDLQAHRSSRPYVLMVGRVTAQKNVAVLLNAFHRFAAVHPEFDLMIAGGLTDVQYVHGLKPLTSERTLLLGQVARSAVPELLCNAALFINVSVHEGCSNATLEAISHGCPILLSAIPENFDLNLPEHIYADPTSPEEIAGRMEDAIAWPEHFTVSSSSFKTWQQVRDHTVEIYRRVMEHTR
jgi:glycosyltransferase involved in cell wall biosynthesis